MIELPELPDEIFKSSPMFNFWDRLYARMSIVECGIDVDGIAFVRPPHPFDWILRPLTKWRRC